MPNALPKLTDAERRILRLMATGWVLTALRCEAGQWLAGWLQAPDGSTERVVPKTRLMALLRCGLIRETTCSCIEYSVYRLTPRGEQAAHVERNTP